MSRTNSSHRWLARHVKDRFVKRARREGARSRATYKLEEIDRRDHLIQAGMTVVDLGAAPGGWSQYAKKRVGGAGRVIAVDILPMTPIPGVEVIEGDFALPPMLDLLRGCLTDGLADLVISDAAPNMSGMASVDQARSIGLAELVLEFADQMLKPGGSMLIKTFQGEGFNSLYARMRGRFAKLVSRKPSASRSESREVFLLGKGFKSD
jgi:23S rRNA (uridine2552-2'-O)-methyltransferase